MIDSFLFLRFFIGLAKQTFVDKMTQALKIIASDWVWRKITPYRCSTSIISSLIAEEPRLFSSSFAAQIITSNISLFDSYTVAHFYNTTIASSTCARTKRKDHLDELERLFVQDFAKNFMTHKQTVNSDKLSVSITKNFHLLFVTLKH